MANDQRFDGSSSSNSSKKNKGQSSGSSSSNSDKPKQPQRGLGVAQLERIRLHHQMAQYGFIPSPHYPPFLHNNLLVPSTTPFQDVQVNMRIQAEYHRAAMQSQSPFGFLPPPCYPPPNNFMMGYGDQMQRTGNIRINEPQSSLAPTWNPNNVSMMGNDQYMQSQGLVTRHLLSHVEQENGRGNSSEAAGPSGQNPEPRTENEELDLDLKL